VSWGWAHHRRHTPLGLETGRAWAGVLPVPQTDGKATDWEQKPPSQFIKSAQSKYLGGPGTRVRRPWAH